MLKKIILGIIIGMVVLTAGVGSIYAYQKNSNTGNEAAIKNSTAYEANTNCTNAKCTGANNEQNCLNQGQCDQLNCTNENCLKQDCANENCTEQYCNRENNCYQYNNDGSGYQNQNNFCNRYNNENQCGSQNPGINGNNKEQNNNSKNGFGKNK